MLSPLQNWLTGAADYDLITLSMSMMLVRHFHTNIFATQNIYMLMLENDFSLQLEKLLKRLQKKQIVDNLFSLLQNDAYLADDVPVG